MKRSRWTMAIFIAAIALVHPSQLCAADLSARTILIIDASSSMSEVREGTTRLEIARQAISRMLADWDPTVDLGLIAFGHRSRTECDDVELIIPPGAVQTERFNTALSQLQGKGVTPLTAAIKLAAATLEYETKPARIIVVTDGVETCSGDPCELSRDIARIGKEVTIELIGFELDAGALSTIECVAVETGGFAVTVDSPEALATALKEAASGDREQAVASEPEGANGNAPKAPGILDIKTLSGERGRPVSAFYSIRKRNESAADALQKSGAGPRFHLDPGAYTVEARWGGASATADFEVRSGETVERTLVLSAGSLELTATLAGSNTPIRAVFQIYRDGGSRSRENELIANNSSGRFTLPEGTYLAGAEWSGIPSPLVGVHVRANATNDATIVIEAGILKIEARAVEGGELIKPHYSIATIPKDSTESPEVTESGAMGPSGFKLPVGKYRVDAEWGAAHATTEVEILPSQTTSARLVLNAATLVLKARSPKGVEARVTYSIEEPVGDGKKRRVIVTGGVREFRVPSGKYIVVARSTDYDGEIELEVASGERKEFEVPLR